jgi:adenosylhomocysteine nucleosidase
MVVKELVTTKGEIQPSPYGEWFSAPWPAHEESEPLVFFHGGWGKIAAAASTQYAISTWKPSLVINLGTCGGFEGQIAKGDIILVTKAVVYDLLDQMGDGVSHLAKYTTTLDISWLKRPYPLVVRESIMVSADKDLDVQEIPHLASTFGAIAGDWESGSIAYVSDRNQTRCLILRGVSDLVGPGGGEAYGAKQVFVEGARNVMSTLLTSLPDWIDHITWQSSPRPSKLGGE